MINNDINNNINKFNGHYLKCVVSQYESVTKWLANSGSLIVVQPPGQFQYKDKNYNRNLIYLGDEFLASGYGFLCKELRDNAEKIIINYDNDIKGIINRIAKEERTRGNADSKLLNEINECVKINGGPIEKTVVNMNGTKITTKDLILYGEPAAYNDIDIESIKITVDGNAFLYNDDILFNEVVVNKELNRINRFNEKNIIYLPIGSKINYITIEIITKDNDTGGIKYLEILHDFNTGEYEENEGLIVKYDLDTENKIEDPIDSNYNTHKFIYSKKIDDGLLINSIKSNIIKNIYMYVKQTPADKYKYYPKLKNKGINVLSTGNIIIDHKIDLNIKLDVVPIYYIKYNFLNDYNCNYDSFYLDKPILIYDDSINSSKIYIQLENDEQRGYKGYENKFSMNIAVPSNFYLQKFYILNVNDYGQNSSNFEQHNMTGAVKLVKENVLLQCPKSDINDSNTYCIYYNVYQISLNNTLEANMNIEIDVIKKNNCENNCILKTINEIENDFISSQIINEYINDEEFNNLYWINGSLYDDNNKLQYALMNMNKNGINKT